MKAWIAVRNSAVVVFGLVAGFITAPLVAVLWPFAFAWWLWNETDGADDDPFGRVDGHGGRSEDADR